MKRLVITIAVLLGLGGASYYYLSYGQEVEQPEILTATISRGSITEYVESTGTLEAVRTVQIGSQVSGIVQALYVDYNSIVHEGQLIAELDPKLLQLQVDIQEANILQRQNDIANQRVQLEADQLNLERTRALAARGLQTEQQLEAAELTVKNREAQIQSAESTLATQRKNLDQAIINVGYTKIYSPIDGVVIERLVDVGQAVQSSMSTPQFFTVATDLRQLKLTGGVDEAEIGKVRPGQEVIFTVDAYGLEEFYGVVESVRLNATVQSNVVTYPVVIKAPNLDFKLKPGMTATLRIVISTVSDVVRVPTAALRFRPTEEVYLALGLTPPRPGQGNAGGRAGQPAANGNRRGAAAQPGAGGTEDPQPGGGQGAGAQEARPGGQGASQTLTPEQAQEFAERFGGREGSSGTTTGRSGRGGGRSGRGGGRGGRGGQQAATSTNPRPAQVGPLQPLQADLIDELFKPLPPRTSRETVWTWNADTKELRGINLTLGVSDGQFSELISGDVQVGDEIITGIILPLSMDSGPSRQSNPFQQRGFGGRGRGRD